MTPIQQMFLGLGAASKTYVDDVYSMFLYTGNNTYPKNIVNGIDLAGEGGAVFGKPRTGSYNWTVHSTEQGVQKGLAFNGTNAQYDNTGNQGGSTTRDLTNFNDNGFTLGTGWSASGINPQDIDVVTYTLRKCPGFFDVVTYTGNGSNRTIDHSLGSVPGMIMVKRLDTGDSWFTYHGSLGGTKRIYLNASNAAVTSSTAWNDTDATSSVFSVGTDSGVNASGGTYVAYVFAGGESTDTSRSVDFDGTDDYLSLGASSDLQLGTGDFTVEGWFKYDYVNDTPAIFDFRSTTGAVTDGFAAFVKASTGKLGLYTAGGWICDDGVALSENQWYHFAVVKSSGTIKLYVNGVQSGSSYTTSTNFTNNTLKIGSGATGANRMWGWISNFRVVKGTAVYTSSFRPQLKTVENITNTVLLCCNNSSVTGSTVTPGTITANGDPTASTDSPGFDDPAGFAFGDAGENVIKCGSYQGNSTANHEIYVGWEPQWWLVKNVTDSQNWQLLDSMRGWVHDANDEYLVPNNNGAESGFNFGNPTATGFNLSNASSNWQNESGKQYVYIAIRRADGYVGKPPELGTDVFTMDTGNSSSTIPCFDSGFPVDFALRKSTTAGWGTDDSKWRAIARLTQGKTLMTHVTDNEDTDSNIPIFDSNVGISKGDDSSFQAWMWKRHAGMDVVTYKGNGSGGRLINHSLNKAPEMMWIKNRTTDGYDWAVYHTGLNGGSSPEDYWVKLNSGSAEADDNGLWNDTAPTSTTFKIGTASAVNRLDDNFLAMLFCSVDGISKVGNYDGIGEMGPAQTITTGFQPRFVLIKTSNVTGNWWLFDTTGGAWGSGFDQHLYLDGMDARHGGSTDSGQPTSTGFTVNKYMNKENESFIYYAHA